MSESRWYSQQNVRGDAAPFTKGDRVRAVVREGRVTDIPPGLGGRVTKVRRRGSLWLANVKWDNGGLSTKIDCRALEVANTALPPEAWKSTPPAEGTRRGLIRDAASNILHSPTLGQGSCDEVALCIADEVEAALLGSGDDEREADAQEAITAVGEALDRIDAPQGATYAERIDRLYSEVRRDAIDAGNEFDRISIPRSTGATGEPGTPRTLTLAERAAICIRRVLTEEEAKRQLEAEVERLLGGREEARSGESRFAEERDCAFALLRWLLPVVVAKRLDCFEAEEETDA